MWRETSALFSRHQHLDNYAIPTGMRRLPLGRWLSVRTSIIHSPSFSDSSILSSHILTPRPVNFFPKSYPSRVFSSTVTRSTSIMADYLYIAETPKDVKEAKGLHLITQSTPNGQATQILLEELADTYGTNWTTTLINISTNEQKKEWFLRLNPNGRIPVLVDNNQSPPFPVIETSAQLLYLLKVYDKEDKFGFKDEFERSQALQWLFFWHGGGAPYQGQVNHFSRAAPEKIPCKCLAQITSSVFVRIESSIFPRLGSTAFVL